MIEIYYYDIGSHTEHTVKYTTDFNDVHNLPDATEYGHYGYRYVEDKEELN